MSRLAESFAEASLDLSVYDHLVIAGRYTANSGTRFVAHLPDPEDSSEPRCNSRRSDTTWTDKQPDQIPNYRLCIDCSGGKQTSSQDRSHFDALNDADESTPWDKIGQRIQEGSS